MATTISGYVAHPNGDHLQGVIELTPVAWRTDTDGTVFSDLMVSAPIIDGVVEISVDTDDEMPWLMFISSNSGTTQLRQHIVLPATGTVDLATLIPTDDPTIAVRPLPGPQGPVGPVGPTGPMGEVKGAASSTDNAVARFDGTTGKIIQGSGVVVADDGSMTVPGEVRFARLAGVGNLLPIDMATFDAGVVGYGSTVATLSAVDTPSRSGKAMKVTATAGSARFYSTTQKMTPVLPGRTYTISGWVYPETTSRSISFRIYDQASSVLANTNNTAPVGQWTKISAVATIPAGVTAIYIYCTHSTQTVAGEVWYWDDLTLHEGIGGRNVPSGFPVVDMGVVYGTGSPEGGVAAPPGTVYCDEAATGGASRWIKSTGIAHTGWVVTQGDTGWRDVSASLVNGWTGQLRVRRMNNTVIWQAPYGTYLNGAAATNDQLVSAPAGFTIISGAGSYPGIAGQLLDSASAAQVVSYTSSGAWLVCKSRNSALRGTFTYPTDAAWPTSLAALSLHGDTDQFTDPAAALSLDGDTDQFTDPDDTPEESA